MFIYNIVKFENNSTFKRTLKWGTKCEKRAKSMAQLLYKNEGKKCGAREIT